MTDPTPTYQGPAIDPSIPWEVKVHLQQIYQKLGNHVQGISLLSNKVSAIVTGATTITEQFSGSGSSGGGSSSSPIGQVNNLTGLTSYTTVAGDNGALIILSDASSIALTLAAGSVPYFIMVANLGTGNATLTPAAPPVGTSTISYAGNLAASSMPLLAGYGAIVGFDGNNWFALTEPIVPINTPAVTHEWLASYNSSTGAFTQTQPAFADISGNLATSQLPTAGISATITTAQLTTLGTQGSMTFLNGILTAQTPAT